MSGNFSAGITAYLGYGIHYITFHAKNHGYILWWESEAESFQDVPINIVAPPTPLQAVSISGPTNLQIGLNGTWQALLTFGIPPINYQWYFEYPDGGGNSSALISNIITPNLGGGGIWYATGGNTDRLTTAFNATVLLKCIVTDATNTTASGITTVNISSSKISQQNSPEVAQGNLVKEELPTSYAFEQNYPNPFNPSTIINYQVPKDGFVSLKVYDILGKEIKTLVNEIKTHGKYSVRFDATDLTSGIYIYQLKVKGFSSIKKMILTK